MVMERRTGFEPATSTLARLRSTTELPPHVILNGYSPLTVNGQETSAGDAPDAHDSRHNAVVSPIFIKDAESKASRDQARRLRAGSGFEPEIPTKGPMCYRYTTLHASSGDRTSPYALITRYDGPDIL